MMILGMIGIAVVAAISLATIGQSDYKAYLAEQGREYCEKMGWQFLDETVALKSMRIRHRHGRWMLTRRYTFEYSPDGIQRHRGEMITQRPWHDPLIRTDDPGLAHRPSVPEENGPSAYKH